MLEFCAVNCETFILNIYCSIGKKNVGRYCLEIVSSNDQLCLFIKECTFAKTEKCTVQLSGCWTLCLCGVEVRSGTRVLLGFQPFIHCDLPLWEICHSIFWMRKHTVLQGHTLHFVTFMSALLLFEGKTVLYPWHNLRYTLGYGKSLIEIHFYLFIYFLLHEPLAILLSFQKVEISSALWGDTA